MSENLIIDNNASKEDKYVTLLPQIEAVIDGEPDIIANMANIASMIHETFQFWWTGFYRVIDNQLVLGPFPGPMACTRIKFGKGGCGTAWKEAQTIIVKDVDQFPGHIACSSASRSEIVVPLKVNGEVVGVLDIDSEKLSNFDSTDQKWLEKVAVLLSAVYKS